MNDARNEFAAPLGSATEGRLEFVLGAANAAVRSDAEMEHLYHARFEGTVPDIGVEDGAITVKYPRSWRKHSADIALNASIPWRIAVGGGLSEVDADLSGLRLDSFEVGGGASRVELTLAEPSGTVRIRIDGGASDVKIHRPEGVAASVLVRGGASKLALDDQRFGALGGEARLKSTGYAGATDRYEVVIARGASDVAVTTRRVDPASGTNSSG